MIFNPWNYGLGAIICGFLLGVSWKKLLVPDEKIPRVLIDDNPLETSCLHNNSSPNTIDPKNYL